MKILVVRFSAMGDIVLTTGPARILRKMKPSAQIDLLTSEVGEEIYQSSPDFDNVIVLEKGSKLSQMTKLYRSMDSYDIVIDWQGNFKSYFLKLFSKAKFYRIKKHSKKRRAYVKNRKFKLDLNQHVVEKYYKVLQEAFRLEHKSIEDLRPTLTGNRISYKKADFDFSKTIAIHPYASQKNKVWPHFHEFIEALQKEGHSVVIIGHDKDSQEWPNGVLNLTNKTSIGEMSAVIAASQALVSTDSGPMHIGIARNTPTLSLFGPTTKEFGFYPIFKNSKIAEIENLECRPCHVHGGNECPKGHFKCLKDLSVETIHASLNSLLEN